MPYPTNPPRRPVFGLRSALTCVNSLSLVQAAYGLTAFDSVIHMVEEIPAPRRNAPRAIWLSVVIGAISGFLFMLVCLFCIQNLDTVINADLPFMQLVQDAIGLQGAAVLLALFIFNGLCQGVSIFTTGSRLTWGFARDGKCPTLLAWLIFLSAAFYPLKDIRVSAI